MLGDPRDDYGPPTSVTNSGQGCLCLHTTYVGAVGAETFFTRAQSPTQCHPDDQRVRDFLQVSISSSDRALRVTRRRCYTKRKKPTSLQNAQNTSGFDHGGRSDLSRAYPHIMPISKFNYVFSQKWAHIPPEAALASSKTATGKHTSEIPIPESHRPVRLCPKALRNPKQLHHQVIHFHILEPVHNVGVVRGRVPTLVLIRHPGLVMNGFHDVREWTVGHEHRVHTEIPVVVAVILEVGLG